MSRFDPRWPTTVCLAGKRRSQTSDHPVRVLVKPASWVEVEKYLPDCPTTSVTRAGLTPHGPRVGSSTPLAVTNKREGGCSRTNTASTALAPCVKIARSEIGTRDPDSVPWATSTLIVRSSSARLSRHNHAVSLTPGSGRSWRARPNPMPRHAVTNPVLRRRPQPEADSPLTAVVESKRAAGREQTTPRPRRPSRPVREPSRGQARGVTAPRRPRQAINAGHSAGRVGLLVVVPVDLGEEHAETRSIGMIGRPHDTLIAGGSFPHTTATFQWAVTPRSPFIPMSRPSAVLPMSSYRMSARTVRPRSAPRKLSPPPEARGPRRQRSWPLPRLG